MNFVYLFFYEYRRKNNVLCVFSNRFCDLIIIYFSFNNLRLPNSH